ncbi:hypothetical protein TWF694_008203 [Orbilia ellipsospora]|uniref:Uncharacterized protein n=1 Tax=Orbilia ellipsospora TaxID=2528407 RepID=A0AAV9XG10_9PEZI
MSNLDIKSKRVRTQGDLTLMNLSVKNLKRDSHDDFFASCRKYFALTLYITVGMLLAWYIDAWVSEIRQPSVPSLITDATPTIIFSYETPSAIMEDSTKDDSIFDDSTYNDSNFSNSTISGLSLHTDTATKIGYDGSTTVESYRIKSTVSSIIAKTYGECTTAIVTEVHVYADLL